MIRILLFAFFWTLVSSQPSESLAEAFAVCSTVPLPASFTRFLNASFLGERQFIEVGPVNYTYFQFGPLSNASAAIGRRPLVLVAGQGATATVWTPDLLQTLAQMRPVTIFTNRGIGLSTDAQPSAASSIAGYAESTVDLIEALQLDQPDILGWSFGGFISLTIAVDYPDMVNRVVVADTTSGGKLGFSVASLVLITPYIFALIAGEPLPPASIFPNTSAGTSGLCRFGAAIGVLPQEPVTADQIKGQYRAIADYLEDPQSTIYNSLGNITNPVLVIAGAQDRILSVQDNVVLVQEIPDASLLVFSDAGHAAILQHAVEAGQVITAFFDSE